MPYRFSNLKLEFIEAVYKIHQRKLREYVKRQFLELLLERAEIYEFFMQGDYDLNNLHVISAQLSDEPRYRALDNIREDREVVLLNFLGFLDRPTTARCLFQLDCADRRIDEVINHSMAKRLRHLDEWSVDGGGGGRGEGMTSMTSMTSLTSSPRSGSRCRNFRLDAASPTLNLIILGVGSIAAEFTRRIRVRTSTLYIV